MEERTMIDEKKLIKQIWGIFNETYNNSLKFNKHETKLANRILCDIQKVIEKQSKIGEWIPCSERLPEEDTDVLIYTPYDGVNMAYIFDGKWRYTSDDEFINTVEGTSILAWQPLPEPYHEP